MSKYPWMEDKVYSRKTACVLDFCVWGKGGVSGPSALFPDEGPHTHLVRGYTVAIAGLDVVV
jgi:hypothetical protein